MPRATPCEIIDGHMASGTLSSFFRDYQIRNNLFPNNLEDLIDFVRSPESGYNESWVEFFESWIKDPYSDENYKYFPIRVDGEIIDYVLYSVGPNKKDDNLSELLAYERGEKEHIVFMTFILTAISIH
ncbi:hypothetical protein [Roseivirga sp.]|uniref:hypothetical protein n=1 Tax=Roseivirga sp. TaxID=1964215 RepID=UPI003B52FEB5